MIHDNDIPLDELSQLISISIRSMNVCKQNGLCSLKDIILHYKKYQSFINLRNCGEKSNTELISICRNIDSLTQTKVINDEKEIEEVATLKALSPFKKSVLNRHFEYLVSNLSLRAKNGILSLLNFNPNIMEVAQTIYNPAFSFFSIKNIGEKSVTELQKLKKELARAISTFQNSDDAVIYREYLKVVCKKNLNSLPGNFDSEMEAIFTPNNKIKIFKLIDLLSKSGTIFNTKEQEIFFNTFSNLQQQSSLELGEKLSLVKERVRQIKNQIEEEVCERFRFLLNLKPEDISNYGLDNTKNFLIINDDYINRYNKLEEVNFTIPFYCEILGFIYNKTYVSFGLNKIFETKNKNSKSKKTKNCYLIRNTIASSIKFDAFLNSVNEIVNSRIEEDYLLHYEGFIANFLNPEYKFSTDISVACEEVLLNEFDLIINSGGYILFEKNTKIQPVKYICTVLEEIGQMAKVDVIIRLLNERYPELELTEQSIRLTLQRDKENFIFFGRSSTYGLKKWESEDQQIKGGTIRSIAAEYLEGYDTPVHIYDICKHVRKFRKSSNVSIFRNMQAEDNNRFIFFDGGFVGLKTKIYKKEETIFNKVSGTHFRLEILKRFNGWKYEDIVSHYARTHSYQRVQIVHILEEKLSSKEIFLNNDNTISI